MSRAAVFQTGDTPAECNECREQFVAGDALAVGRMYGAKWAKHLRCYEPSPDRLPASLRVDRGGKGRS